MYVGVFCALHVPSYVGRADLASQKISTQAMHFDMCDVVHGLPQAGNSTQELAWQGRFAGDRGVLCKMRLERTESQLHGADRAKAAYE